ncbi:MAG: alpha-ketoacid dehydrogenase subunit beta [Thermoleophilia bacterium]
MTAETTATTVAAENSDSATAATITYVQALNDALREEMQRDETVFIMGEDIAVWGGGGVFGVTRGLLDEFGPERVRDTPISEAGFTGMGIGAALTGMRPIVEYMYVDFSMVAMDQILNQAAKIRYMFGGKAKVPLVLRTQEGAGRGNGPQHSQSIETIFAHVPGLKVVVPSTPADAKGLLKTAIRDDNPVVFLEHKLLYGKKGEVPAGEHLVPFGQANVLRQGSHITFVGIHITLDMALEAAETLAAEGIELEVIDPRTLVPYDRETVAESVRKTGRLIVSHQAPERVGYATEIITCALEDAFDYFDAPPVRLCAANMPVPYAKSLEDAAMPQTEDIIQAARRLMKGTSVGGGVA